MPIGKSMFLFAFSVTAVAQAENQPPIVLIHDAAATDAGDVSVVYSLFDAEEDASDLTYGLYVYPNSRLASAGDRCWGRGSPCWPPRSVSRSRNGCSVVGEEILAPSTSRCAEPFDTSAAHRG